jgi:hypothetical protein
MRPITVVLDFTCQCCGHPVGATVRCSGPGLAEGPHTVAAVKIVCPTCDGTTRVCFEPCGLIRALDAWPDPHEALVPSLN